MNKNTLSAIICSISAILFFVLVWPEYQTTNNLKESLSVRQLVLSDRKAAVSRVSELEAEINSRQADIKKIKTFLPERKQIDEIVSGLQSMTQESGLQLLAMTTSDVSGFEDIDYKKVLVSIDVVGRYPAFVEFLKLLEKSLRLYDGFEVSAGVSTAANSVTDNVNFTVKMHAYYNE